MAEQVTRKFTNKTDGTPRTGLNLRLVSLTKPTLDPFPLVEVVTTVEADQGQYYAANPGGTMIADVPHGVYQIQRDSGAGYVNFEGMLTVEPGRVEGLETGKFPLSDRVNTSITQVSAFMGDTEQGTLSVIQRALNYAASTTKHVKVGAWGPAGANVTWTGSPITVPDGVTLDLCGATLYADAANDVPVITFAGAGCVLNGYLKTKHVSGSRACTQSEPTSNVAFINIGFIRPGTAHPTCASTTDSESLCAFISCLNVTLAVAGGSGGYTRLQRAFGCQPVYEVGGSIPILPIEQANVQAIEVAEIIKNITTALGSSPSTTPPFGNGTSFVEAVKHLWFEKQASWDASIATLSANQAVTRLNWRGASGPTHLNGDPGRLYVTSVSAIGDSGHSISIYSTTVNNLERRCLITGQTGMERLILNCAGTITFNASAVAGGHIYLGLRVDLSDLSSAIAAVFPGIPDQFSQYEYPGTSYSKSLNSPFIKKQFFCRSPGTATFWPQQEYPSTYSPDGEIYMNASLGNSSSPTIELSCSFRQGVADHQDTVFQFGIEVDMPLRKNSDHNIDTANPLYGSIFDLSTITR